MCKINNFISLKVKELLAQKCKDGFDQECNQIILLKYTCLSSSCIYSQQADNDVYSSQLNRMDVR